MREALKEARRAEAEGEIPIGAVVVCEGRIIARAHNQTETLHDPTAHAEMLAMTAATAYIGGKYLPECTLYVTVEPCPMCAAAMAWTQVGAVEARLHPFLPFPPPSEDEGQQRSAVRRVRRHYDRIFQKDKTLTGQWTWNFCSTSATSACSSAPSSPLPSSRSHRTSSSSASS